MPREEPDEEEDLPLPPDLASANLAKEREDEINESSFTWRPSQVETGRTRMSRSQVKPGVCVFVRLKLGARYEPGKTPDA